MSRGPVSASPIPSPITGSIPSWAPNWFTRSIAPWASLSIRRGFSISPPWPSSKPSWWRSIPRRSPAGWSRIPSRPHLEPAVRHRSRTAVGAAFEREPIAVIGASGRFARSSTIDELWGHLIAGHDLVEPVSRFDLEPFYKDVAPGTYGRHGSFIDGIEQFDPVFFGISGLEATYMDPQQRLFLEEAWKTLEIAGHGGADIEGTRCGVFVGCSSGDYHELFRTQPPGQAFWGNTGSLVPARIAYSLNLKGPAIAVDTACSSSLVAVHLACQSLWSRESEMALAGGVFVQSTARFYRYANQARMLSPSGRCAAFGEGADGIVPGEAVGAVLLRPLSAALADGDTILGMIVGSGTNQDGTTNGITAPSAVSQESLIRRVYEDFGIDPATIGLVEAHGTGTVLGDPIEQAALTRAFGAFDRPDRFLRPGVGQIQHRPYHDGGGHRRVHQGAVVAQERAHPAVDPLWCR